MIVYNVSGRRHKYEVYKPETGTKFYVRKLTIAGGKKVGSDKAWPSKEAAVRDADRRARDEGVMV